MIFQKASVVVSATEMHEWLCASYGMLPNVLGSMIFCCIGCGCTSCLLGRLLPTMPSLDVILGRWLIRSLSMNWLDALELDIDCDLSSAPSLEKCLADDRRDICGLELHVVCDASFIRLESDVEPMSIDSLASSASIDSIGVPGMFSLLIVGPKTSLNGTRNARKSTSMIVHRATCAA